MQNQQEEPARAGGDSASGRHDRSAADFPIREYVGAMAAELAQMARWDGDEQLACLLDAAAQAASRKPEG